MLHEAERKACKRRYFYMLAGRDINDNSGGII